MKNAKPSLAARAISTLVREWASFRDGDYLATTLNLSGLNTVGYGSFSAIVEGNPNQVIKVFDQKDLGYKLMLETMITNDTPFLPMVYSYSTSGRYGIVEMERLTTNVKAAVRVSNIIDQIKSGSKVRHTLGGEFVHLIKTIDGKLVQYNKDFPLGEEMTWDSHDGNIMFREKTPVLIDMLFCEE